MKGYWMLTLHSHLPFVKHPEYEYFLEEHWLYEAISETYIPLLMNLKKLEEENIYFKLTVSLTPPLCEMLSDKLLMNRYNKYIDKLIELASKEVNRTKNNEKENHLANFYLNRFQELKHFFNGFLQNNILNGYKYFKNKNNIEIITCGATHGFLPFLNEKAVEAQIKMAVDNYEKHFKSKPKGIWLPECAYYEGLENILNKYGIKFFFLDSHGILLSKPKPVYGVFAPVFTSNGIAAFGRDFKSSKQVWSSKEGYPGDYEYRDFYRDIGYDLDFDYIKDYINPDGIRVFTGIKYHKITGETDHKEYYNPISAENKTAIHAKHFVEERMNQVKELESLIDRNPLIVSPYDAELFGHWWFEGPKFLYNVFKEMENSEITPITPLEYLKLYPENQIVKPHPSSWGDKGYYDVWLNESNDWIYKHLTVMADIMTEKANKYYETKDKQLIALLNQMARELFLAQSSDWAFLMTTKTALEYAVKRTKEHIYNFMRLNEMLESGNPDERYLNKIFSKNSIFQEIDFKIFC
jgi:1,4-alpha-glucan branching enzyme